MPAPKSSTASSGSRTAKPKARKATSKATAATKVPPREQAPARNAGNPLDLVILTRDRIQETLDEAARRGRVTRSDANDLVAELVKRGRNQTDDVLAEIEKRVNRGREQIGSATRKARRAEPVDRIVRTADRARRTAKVGPAFPILGYDDLTAGQVTGRIDELKPAELRKVRDYERRHANRKSVLDAVEKALA
jgi:polyhydroxyalkanoate synthesis regulator phasin